jgi:hypothetical protein
LRRGTQINPHPAAVEPVAMGGPLDADARRNRRDEAWERKRAARVGRRAAS